jgi:molybdopterin molybdotransferase
MLFAGLPGNPTAALVTLRQIALPAIRKTAGLSDVEPSWLPAVAGFDYEKKLGRTEFVPVRQIGTDDVGRPILEMLGRGSSSSLSAMALADGIAMLRPDTSVIQHGNLLNFESLIS